MERNWEDLISLNSLEDGEFETLDCAAYYKDERLDKIKKSYDTGNVEKALSKDIYPLPIPSDREKYFGQDHFGYWLSGYHDFENLLNCSQNYKIDLKTYFDFGCASGRVIRHFATLRPDIDIIGSDINRRHIDWINKYLPKCVLAFQNHSIPAMPIADESVDLISAYSVFTHIESFEIAWLMELRRILRPNGMIWLTVHSEKTWEEMEDSWPLYRGLRNHPKFKKLDSTKPLPGDRVVFRWHSDKSYTSNVFYSFDYINKVFGRILEIVEIKRRFPRWQDVVLLRKR